MKKLIEKMRLKVMDDLGVSTVDLVTDDDKKTVPSPEKKEDPFAKYAKKRQNDHDNHNDHRDFLKSTFLWFFICHKFLNKNIL